MRDCVHHLVGHFHFIKVFREVNGGQTNVAENLYSLHACCQSSVTHLKEHHPQTVDVHFLKESNYN